MKPIPPEARESLKRIRQMGDEITGDMDDPRVRREFEAKFVAEDNRLAELLRGTEAGPLIARQRELVRELRQATRAGDAEKAGELGREVQARGKEVEELIDRSSDSGSPAPAAATDSKAQALRGAQTVVAIALTGCGLLMIVLSLPLILRMVPPNALYGMRIPAAFASEKDWHAGAARALEPGAAQPRSRPSAPKGFIAR